MRGSRKPIVQLDFEFPLRSVHGLASPGRFGAASAEKVIVLDEIHRVPELFTLLRPLIDKRRREGEAAEQFPLFGSSPPDVARGASTTLAGRIAHFELGPLDQLEVW